MKENRTSITLNEQLSGNAFRLRFAVDWPAYDPGQFVMVGIPGNAVFLRRPFGIARLSEGFAEICYKVVGRGTKALSMTAAGTPINITGPCGRGYTLPSKGETAVLVAGGYGIGPMLGLLEKLRSLKQEVIIYYGARCETELLYMKELKSLGAGLRIATDDGSREFKGFITDRLKGEIDSIKKPALFACGPEGLMKEIARIGHERKIPSQVSLDSYMACGIGVCNGCVCKGADGLYKRTCREGPVFEVRELEWH